MSIQTGKTFVLVGDHGEEIDGGALDQFTGGQMDRLTNIRRVILWDAVSGLQAPGLNSAVAVVDTSGVPALTGYTPNHATLNRVFAWKVSIPATDAMTVNNFSVILTRAFRAGSRFGVALYNSTGTTKLIDTGALDGTVTGLRTIAQSAVALAAGQYWLAMTTPPGKIYEDVNLFPPFVLTPPGAYHSCQQNLPVVLSALNQSTPRAIIAGNTAVAGQLPATLGTLTTPQDGNNAALPPWILLN